jgi:tetratricopeptide (TPR) repeat protein
VTDGDARAALARARSSAAGGDIEGALTHANDAICLARDGADPILGAACHELCGDILLRLGKVEDARQQLTLARDIYRQHGERVGEANVDLSFGRIAERIGDIDGAAAHFSAAHDGYVRAGRPRGAAQALSGLGWANSARGRFDEAMEQCARALALVEGLDAPEAIATARLTRALIQLARDPRAAAAELDEVLRAYQQLSDNVGIANTHRLLMEAAAKVNDLARAQVHFRAAVHGYRVIGSPWGEALCWSFNADLLRQVNDYQGAEVAFAAAEAQYASAGATAAAAKSCAYRGRLMVNRGAIQDGLALLDRAAALAVESGARGVPVRVPFDPAETRHALEVIEAVRATLSTSARDLLDVLSALEVTDWVPAVAAPVFEWLSQTAPVEVGRTSFAQAVAELQRAQIIDVRRTEAGAQYYDVAARVRDWARALVAPARAADIRGVIGKTWSTELARDAGAPGPRTVRAGLGAAVYSKRARQFTQSFALLEATLEVAKATGEAWHVVPHFYLLVLASEDHILAGRLEALEANGALKVEGPPS